MNWCSVKLGVLCSSGRQIPLLWEGVCMFPPLDTSGFNCLNLSMASSSISTAHSAPVFHTIHSPSWGSIVLMDESTGFLEPMFSCLAHGQHAHEACILLVCVRGQVFLRFQTCSSPNLPDFQNSAMANQSLNHGG